MNRSARVLYILLLSICLLALGIFGGWWFQPGHLPHNFSGGLRVFDIILFGLLSYIIWHPIVMRLLTWAVAYNCKALKTPKPQDNLKVAFITTFVPGSESISLLHRTLPAMVRAYYKHDTWLLDEGDDPEVARLCKRFGVQHFSRHGKAHYNTESGRFAKKTKGGNHNAWYDAHGKDYDIVAQIDTDFIPKKTFLIKTLGYFRDDKIAFVGTPQIYGNTTASFVAQAAAEQSYSFYGPMLRGFSGMGMAMLIGANHVIRVTALKSVGYYSAHITEDLLTGMKLHANQWKSVYVAEPLAIGEGPSTWRSFFSQQMRWAYGCIDVLFFHSFKLMKSMSLRQATYYFILQQHYFSGLAMMVSALLLALYFVCGIEGAHMDALQFVTLYSLLLFSGGLMNFWLQRFNARPKKESGLLITGRVAGVAAWPIYFLALMSVLLGRRLTYKVTRKGHGNAAYEAPLELFIPHIGVGVVSLLFVVSSVITKHNSPVMLFWSICSAVLMLSIPFALPIAYTFTRVYTALRTTITRFNQQYRLPQSRNYHPSISNWYPSSTLV